jgi:hypothetical protein
MTPRLDSLLRELHSLERRQRGGMPHHAHRGSDWLDDWQARLNRVERVQGALFLSGPTATRILVERLPGIDVGAIGEILLSACKDIALVWGGSVLLGGAGGAAVGFFFGGVGAVPGAVAGAGLGVQAGAWIMGVLGLKALAEDLAETLPQALAHYERGIRMAWGPVKAWDAQDDMHRAHHELAEGHIVLMTAILAALSAFLTRGRGDPAARARVLAEIRQSPRLGPKVADWLAAQEERLVAHPALKPKQQQVMMASARARDAGSPVSPSQLRQLKGGSKEPDEPPPPRKPEPPKLKAMPQKRVRCFKPNNLPKSKYPELDRQLAGQERGLNTMTVDEYLKGREAFSSSIRDPDVARKARATFERENAEKLFRQLRSEGVSRGEAKAQAAAMTSEKMKTLAALHNPDLYAGGKDVIADFGDRNVNARIGAQWKVESRAQPKSRAAELDDAARRVPPAERGNMNMNAKLERCP